VLEVLDSSCAFFELDGEVTTLIFVDIDGFVELNDGLIIATTSVVEDGDSILTLPDPDFIIADRTGVSSDRDLIILAHLSVSGEIDHAAIVLGFKTTISLFPIFDDGKMTFDGGLQSEALLFECSVFSTINSELITNSFEVTVFRFPLRDDGEMALDGGLHGEAFLFEYTKSAAFHFHGLELLEESVIFLVKFLEMVSGLPELLFSGFVLVLVHFLEFFELKDLSPKSFDFNVEIFVLLLIVKNLFLQADDFISENIVLFNVLLDGNVEFRDSNFIMLLGFHKSGVRSTIVGSVINVGM